MVQIDGEGVSHRARSSTGMQVRKQSMDKTPVSDSLNGCYNIFSTRSRYEDRCEVTKTRWVRLKYYVQYS